MTTRLRGPFGLLSLVAFAAIARAQADEQAPKPGPELQKLAYFAGNWRGTLQGKASQFGPAGSVTDVYRSEWMPGNLFMRTNAEERTPSGTATAFSIIGYDKQKKVYVEYDFDGHGDIEHWEGTVTSDHAGDTWTWTTEYVMNGKPIKIRSLNTPRSATTYDSIVQMAASGTDWQTVREGTMTKVP